MSEHPYRNREYNDSYLPSSTKSTPQKPRIKPLMASLPSTPNTERPGSANYRRPPRFTPKRKQRVMQPSFNQSTDGDSILSSPEKRDNRKMLGEIDQFLNNVKTIQRVSSQSKNDQQFEKPALTVHDLNTSNETEKRFSQLNLKQVNEMLQNIEDQQKFMDLRDRQVESLYENKNFCKKQFWQCGDTKNSVPDFGFGMRDILYSEETISPQFIKQIELRDSKSDSQSNSEQTFQTVVEKRSTIPQIHSKSSPAVQTSIPDKLSIKSPEKRPPKFVNRAETDSSAENGELSDDTEKNVNPARSLPMNLTDKFNMSVEVPQTSSVSSINLFSLADIWNSTGTKISDKEMKKLLPKLEEEKCRRKHCEKLIQELQMKILEMQQRLAVAVQVDCAKDEAILRFHEAWEKVANRWKNLESERNTLSQKLVSIEQKSSTELAEASQKVVQIELEMSKALDLAQNSQEKCNALEKEKNEFVQKLNSLKLELKTSHNTLKDLSDQKQQLNDKIVNLERESLNDKRLLLESQNEVSKSKTTFLKCQKELAILKDDYIKLEAKVKEKQDVISTLESQKNNLQVSLDAMKKNELALQKQIKTVQEDSERAKHELRNFYQQQVEILVKDKLKEFQDQLENAEKSLQDELQVREQMIAKTAAKQLQKLSEKHRLEVQLIEEKHKEEIRLYDLQFNQMKQQIQALENKLESYQARRSNIAQELHNIMEQQWLEALRIINNVNKTPSSGPSSLPPPQTAQKEPQISPNELNYTQFKQLLASREAASKPGQIVQKEAQIEPQSDVNFAQLRSILTSKENVAKKAEEVQKEVLDRKFDDERSLPGEVFETPVSSKHNVETSGIQFPEFELQKYIKMLLDKLPRSSMEKPAKEEKKSQLSSRESSTSDFADVSSTWNLQSQIQMPKSDEKSSAIREQRPGKPPWK